MRFVSAFRTAICSCSFFELIDLALEFQIVVSLRPIKEGTR
jgi:hypothetical protein